jgi:hypothetical protein
MVMHTSRMTLSAVGAMWCLACGKPQAPVPIVGAQADISSLAGDWTGEYSSVESGRRGSILFHLTAGTDTARGDVVMSPMWIGRPPASDAPRAGGDVPSTQVLQIQFVQVAGGQVSGQLAPYTDPSCGCTLRTSFTGRLRADTLEGTYTSLHQQTGDRQAGRWRVVRDRP